MNNRQWNQGLSLIMGIIIFLLAAPFSPLQFVLEITQYAPQKTILKASFPDSLYYIGDEAFSDTSIEVAVFSNTLQSIGINAFLNAKRMTDVYIPAKTEHIGSNAFPEQAFIHGAEGSYAKTWALQNSYVFIEDDIWNFKSDFPNPYYSLSLALLGYVLPIDTGLMEWIRRQTIKYVKSMRPKDRPELYPINYRFP